MGANIGGLMAGARLGLMQKRTEELVWGVRVAAGVPEAYFRPAVPRAALCLLITSAENCSRSLVPRATVACRELLPVCDAESCSRPDVQRATLAILLWAFQPPRAPPELCNK